MHTTRIADFLAKHWANYMLFGVLFFTSVCFIDTSKQFFMCVCFACRYMKIAISFIMPFCATIVYYVKRKNLVHIGDTAATIMTIFSVLFLLDCLTFRVCWQIHRAIALYHFVYGGLTFFAVYLASTILTIHNQKNGKLNNNFSKMNRAFFLGLISFLIAGILMIYFIDRDYFQNEIATNLIPTQGAIKNMIEKREILEIVRNVGNVGFFVGISLVMCEFSTKNKRLLFGIIIPTLFSVSMEIYQYFLKCGDMDIDDVIINFAGAVFGYIIYQTVITKLKEKEI